MRAETTRVSKTRTAELGELVHDRGARDDEAWFIVGEGGYWDVTNACWVNDHPDDAPWTTEFFNLYGPAEAAMLRGVTSSSQSLRAAARRHRDNPAYVQKPDEPILTPEEKTP